MKSMLRSLLLVVALALCALPARAAVTLSAINDAITLQKCNTAASDVFLFSTNNAATGYTITFEGSHDGGGTWTSIAATTKTQTGATGATTTSTGRYEVPVASAAYATCRARLSVGATSGSLTADAYLEGAQPKVAVVFDTTSGTNAAIDTGAIDVSAWSGVYIEATASGGVPAFALFRVDDAAASLQLASLATSPLVAGLGAYGVLGGAGTGVSTQLPLPKRIRATSAAIAAQTSRVLIYGRP